MPIGTVAGKGRKVVLSLGADSETDSPLPDLAAGDRLLAFAELELTTDADDPHQPGPDRQRVLLLARRRGDAAARRGRRGATRRSRRGRSSWPAIRGDGTSATSATTRWSPSATPSSGAGRRPAVARARLHQPGRQREPSRGEAAATCCWSARTRPRPSSSRTWPGSGWCASAPATQPEPPRRARGTPACAPGCRSRSGDRGALPRAPRPRAGRAAAGPRAAGHRRRRACLAGADLDPDVRRRLAGSDRAGRSRRDRRSSWKGHLSKFTGFNCMPGDGPQASSKYGVATVREAPGRRAST